MRVPTVGRWPFTTETNYTHCDILLLDVSLVMPGSKELRSDRGGCEAEFL